MNVATLANNAYARSRATIRTDRSIEYEVFARITHNLKTAISSGNQGFSQLVSALHDNRRLWTILASDVAGDQNALPRELRAKIFYLAEYTNHHTRKVLNGNATANALVDVNMAVMRGLQGELAEAST